MAKRGFVDNRGLIEEEERRSYGAVFVLFVALLVACTVWAVWQDTFSRHLWKKYKTDFYRLAIEKYEGELAAEHERLADDEDFIRLSEELEQLRRDLSTGETADRIDSLNRRKEKAEVRIFETDLELRFVKGEIEEAWYRFDHAMQHHGSADKERRVLDELEDSRKLAVQVLEGAKGKLATIETELEEIESRERSLVRQLRPYSKNLDSLEQKLDSVSMTLFGRRVARVPTIEQVVLPNFDKNNFDQWVSKVERCQNCHVAIDRSGFEEQPNPFKTHPERRYYLGNHEVRKFGCTPCHGGEGAAVNSVEQAHGLDHYWEDPLVPLDGRAQARCLQCHVTLQGLEGTGVAARGERLFQEMGCHGCHLAYGYEHLKKVGPSLTRVAAKASPEWMVEWIADPQAFRPRTRMPNFKLGVAEAEAITAYLLSDSFGAAMAWLDTHPEPKGVDPGDEALVGRGRELTGSLGCLGCHGFEADAYASQVALGKDTGPNLARVGEKTNARWIYNWIRDPRGYAEHTKMPSLRLSDGEARAITSYLVTLKEGKVRGADRELRARLTDAAVVERGERLVRKNGCFGCHDIAGMRGESRIGAELTAFGSKHVEELFFGNRTDIPRTWYDWTVNKILTPRTYATERIQQVMPRFGFEEEDAWALADFLSSRVDRAVNSLYYHDDEKAAAAMAGRELVDYYNCNGCHSLEGKPGAIRRYYEEEPDNAPPILEGEGAKLQPEWFHNFLLQPVRLRPWLDVRMPTFGLSTLEADKIVGYFSTVDGLDLGPVLITGQNGDVPVPAAPAETPGGDVDCLACHQAGPGRTVPELYSVARKTTLTPEQIDDWLEEHLGVERRPEQDNTAAIRSFLGVEAD